MNDIANMTGQNNFNAPRALVLDEMKLQGNSVGAVGGYFKLVGLTEEKKEDGKYPVYPFQQKEPVTLVFLIVRRRLIESDKDGLKRWTSEHDTPNDVVQLFGADKDRGPASELRVKYPDLRTEQVVYCRYKGKTVRLRVKGLSLQRHEGVPSFYDYMQSFKGEGFHEYATKMTPIEVTTDLGKHWAIHLERGNKLTEEQHALVITNIKEVYTRNKEIDAYYNKTAALDEMIEKKFENMNTNDVEYVEEDINPENIPF